jgi:lysophospholipase L1-like esterase
MNSMRAWTMKLTAAAALSALAACGGSRVDASGVTGSEVVRAAARLPAAAPAYLALGDSLPFGWSDALADAKVPQRFFGYPKYLAGMLGLPLLDAACPSEASGSFISSSAPDDGCRAYREEHALHVDYDGTQLAYALEVARTHPRLDLVTLQLGANDLQLLVKGCLGDPGCIQAGAQAALGATANNVATIVGALHLSGYSGQVVVVDYYNPSTNPLQDALIRALNQALAAAAGAVRADFVDLYAPFAQAAAEAGGDPCDTGLIATVDGRCEIHPSREGHRLIAALIEEVVERRP